MTIQIPTTKYCPDCGKNRPVAVFGKNASRYDGLTSYCHKHQLERDRARRARDPEKFRDYRRTYQEKLRAEQLPLLSPAVKKTCNCRKWNTCLICRNAERRRAFRAGDVPVYRRIAAIGD
jgi:hypothetical protein